MRLVFLGTPEFAVPSLSACVQGGHDVAAVFTQPDRPSGRGQQIQPSPVKRAAVSLGLVVHQPERVRRPEVVELLAGMTADAMVVVGYGQIIPQSIIDLPRLGIINVHASLLPKYRGAAPIQWAIANGEAITGVTTMQIDAGLDTGGILMTKQVAIGPEETAPELSSRLSSIGADLLVTTLAGLQAGTLHAVPQNPAEATMAPILTKEHGRIDWTDSAAVIANRIRGFLPWPGCYTEFRGQTLHLWRARPAEESSIGMPGTIVTDRRRFLVRCSEGSVLEVLEVQSEGRKRMPADAFRNGVRLESDEQLGKDRRIHH